MDTHKTKWKAEISNVLIALGAFLIALFSFNYFKPPIENMLAAMVFILTLILLNQK